MATEDDGSCNYSEGCGDDDPGDPCADGNCDGPSGPNPCGEEGPVCHGDASCIEDVCVCNEGYIGDGVESCSDDFDFDGLTNSAENDIGTDPKNADTDGDGLNDGKEYSDGCLDPLKSDTDGDGLSDGEEVNDFSCNPCKSDTDGDGLTDFPEVNAYKTDPNKKDTDDDGLTDEEEIMSYKTDPNKKDTDDGGVDDGPEVKRGTNPLDDRDDPDPDLCCCPADGGDAAAYVEVTSTYAPDTVVAQCEALSGYVYGGAVHEAFMETYNAVVFAADGAYPPGSCGCYKNAEGYEGEGNAGASNSPVGTGATNAAEQDARGSKKSKKE